MNGEPGLGAMAAACDRIASAAKALQFKTARLVSAHRMFDPAPMIEEMASAFDQTMQDRETATAQ
jgi:hypothetical protein